MLKNILVIITYGTYTFSNMVSYSSNFVFQDIISFPLPRLHHLLLDEIQSLGLIENKNKK